MPLDRDRRTWLTILFVGVSLLTGCVKQEEEPEAQPAPSGASDSATPGTENSTDSSQPQEQPGGPSAQPIPSALDLSYITDDFTGAIIVHPARFLSWELFQQAEEAKVPIDDMVRDFRRDSGIYFDPSDFGVSLRNVDQIIVLLDQRTASFAPAVLPPPLGNPEMDFRPPGAKFIEEEPLERPLDGGQDPSLIKVEKDAAVADEQEKWEAPFPTVIVRFNAADAVNKILELGELAALQFSEFEGLKVKRLQEEGLDVVFHPVGDKTLIVTRTRLIKKMAENQLADSPLIAELNHVDPSHDFILVADLSPFREILEKAGGMLQDFVPPNLAPLSAAPAKTQVLTLTAGVNSDALLSLSLKMDAAGDTSAVNDVISQLLEQGRQAYQTQRAMFAGPNGPFNDATRAQLTMLADQIVQGTSSVTEGQRLTLTVPTPKDFDQLATILTPALKRGGRAAELARRKNKVKLIGLAFHNYHDVHQLLPGAGSDASGKQTGLSWRVHLLPFLDHAPLYEQFHLNEPWDSAHNKALIQQMPDIFKSNGVDDPTKTSFHMFVGENAYSEIGGTRFRDITDGLSNTLLAVEAGTDKAEIWTKPGGLKYDEAKPLTSLGTLPDDFFLALFGDGRVRQISKRIDLEILKALITINGGETVRDF